MHHGHHPNSFCLPVNKQDKDVISLFIVATIQTFSPLIMEGKLDFQHNKCCNYMNITNRIPVPYGGKFQQNLMEEKLVYIIFVGIHI